MTSPISQFLLDSFILLWPSDSDSSNPDLPMNPMHNVADGSSTSMQSTSSRADHVSHIPSSIADADRAELPTVVQTTRGPSEISLEVDDLEGQTRSASRTSAVRSNLKRAWEKAFTITLYVLAYLILHSLHSFVSTSNSSPGSTGTVVVVPIQTVPAVQ